MGMLGWPHLLLIVAVLILLFGAAKLPALAKSVGQSARLFKGEIKAMQDDGPGSPVDQPSAAERGSRVTGVSG